MADIQPSDYYGSTGVSVVGNKTLALADCGIIQNVQADGLVMTLPASAAGLTFTIRIGGVIPAAGAPGAVSDASMSLTITPNGTDTVGGNGFTPAASKGAQSLKTALNRVGDLITLSAGTANTWIVTGTTGTWTRTP